MNAQRAKILELARRLLGVPYENGAAAPASGSSPAAIDCSGLICWVSIKLYGSDARLSPGDYYPTARTMFAKLAPTKTPEPGDLALYSRPDRTLDEVWHVMFVVEGGGVLGACDEAGKVHTYPKVEYAKTWRFKGYRSFPLTPAPAQAKP